MRFIASALLVSASPTVQLKNDELNDVKSLEKDAQTFTMKCGNGAEIIADKKVLMKSPVLATTMARLASTNREIFIGIKECYQETLNLATEFMSGDLKIWKKFKPLHIENLVILADTLQLQTLYDQCIIWIVKSIYLDEFQLSELWKQKFPELEREIHSLYNMVTNGRDMKFGEDPYLQVNVKGNDYFQQLGEIKKFSGLRVVIQSTVQEPAVNCNIIQRWFQKIKKCLGYKVRLAGSVRFNKSIRVKSLVFDHSDQSKLHFLANGANYPILKSLSIRNCVSDLTKLSKALNDGKLPSLEVLDLSFNMKLKLKTLRLTSDISLKQLKLVCCGLKKISHLANILNHLPELEELNLEWNEMKLNTLKLNKDIQLKRLNLATCELTDISFLAKLLNAHLPSLEELNLSYNPNIQLKTFELETPHLSLKRLHVSGCELTDISPLSDILKMMPAIKELHLEGNEKIQLNSLSHSSHDLLRTRLFC